MRKRMSRERTKRFRPCKAQQWRFFDRLELRRRNIRVRRSLKCSTFLCLATKHTRCWVCKRVQIVCRNFRIFSVKRFSPFSSHVFAKYFVTSSGRMDSRGRLNTIWNPISAECLPWKWINTHICLILWSTKVRLLLSIEKYSIHHSSCLLKLTTFNKWLVFPFSLWNLVALGNTQEETYNLYLFTFDNKSYPEIACIVSIHCVLCRVRCFTWEIGWVFSVKERKIKW